MRAMLSSITGCSTSAMALGSVVTTLVISSSSVATFSAICCGLKPVCIMALAMKNKAPSLSTPLSLRASTTTLGSGTSLSSTPSMPIKRHRVRSTATVVYCSTKVCTSCAMPLAKPLAYSTFSKSKPNLLFCILHYLYSSYSVFSNSCLARSIHSGSMPRL